MVLTPKGPRRKPRNWIPSPLTPEPEGQRAFAWWAITWAERCKNKRAKDYPEKWVLFSGGNDSLVLLHYITQSIGIPVAGVLHINTGTGVPETSAFAKQVVERWGLRWEEYRPAESYEEVFINQGIIDGLPGPGMHFVAYNRLKYRPVLDFWRDHKREHWDRVIFLTGIRAAESVKRMGYGERIVDRDGGMIWVNPIYRWTDEQMRAYRKIHNLPTNPVAEHLHISGECLCGTFAKPGELDEIDFFYPEVAQRIRGWERAAKEKGLTYCQWGQKRSGKKDNGGRLCSTCVLEQEHVHADDQTVYVKKGRG